MTPLPEGIAITPAAVRQPLLHGHQPVAGLWFPHGWLDEHARARRLLAHWRAGSHALRFADGDLLRYAAPQEVQCGVLGGWPLRLHGQTLCSSPLTPAEAAALPVADLWLVQGGQVSALHFRDAQALAPSQWLAIDRLALHDTYDCRTVLPPPVDLTAVDVRDLREVLNGRVPQASEEQRAFLRALASRTQGASGDAPSPAQGGLGGASSSPFRFSPWVAVVLILCIVAIVLNSVDLANIPVLGLIAFLALGVYLRRWFQSGSCWTVNTPSVARQISRPVAPATTVSERATGVVKPQAWRRWLARLAVTSQLSRLLGRRQAAYMRKMLELFESGQLDEALRHAIPLGGEGQSLGQAFDAPRARDSLSLSRGGSANVSIHLGNDLDAYLRRLYRQSFEKLDREGRIDEAVFVLAELLKARQEALDCLEKHARYQQAAELALAWDCPSDVIVRLHCLAGDWRHAVAVARRDKSFANAVLQLEKRWPDAAARLRVEWAQSLAASGDWLGAVEAIWPLPAQHGLATEWLLTAEAAGGRLGARALVKRAVLLPDTWVDCAARLEALRDDPQCHAERVAVAQAVLGLKERNTQALQLVRMLLPATLADQSRGCGQLTKNDMQRLINLAADPWLLADLPKQALPARTQQVLGTSKVVLQGQLPEPGGLAILDAAALDDGLHLVALGEAGAAIVDGHGKITSRFTVPAERIVMAHNRQVALVLAQRDGVSRVSRLEIARRRVVDLGMAELAHVATEFDGIAWTVAHGTRLQVLDTQHALQEVLWQVSDLPGQVRALSASAHAEQMVVEDERGNMEVWRYALPARRLLARGEALPVRTPHTALRLLNPNGGVIDILKEPDGHGHASISYRLHTRTFCVDAGLADADQSLAVDAVVNSSWLVLSLKGQAFHQLHVVSLDNGQVRASVDWSAQAEPRLRLDAGSCTVFDAQGRLWSLDMATSVASQCR